MNTKKFFHQTIPAEIQGKPLQAPQKIDLREKPTLSPQQIQDIARQNAEKLKKPVKILGKTGDTFYFNQEKYLILERTPRYMFVEVHPMELNPDLTPPSVPDKSRKLLSGYYDVRRIGIHQEQLLDGYDQPTGFLTERKEYIGLNYFLEFIPVDSHGIPIPGKMGFNKDREQVYQRYLQVVQDYEKTQELKVNSEKEREKAEALEGIKVRKIAAAKELRTVTLNELTSQLKGCSIQGALGDKKIVGLVDQLNRLELILKTIVKDR